jgi:hypothetical protein
MIRSSITPRRFLLAFACVVATGCVSSPPSPQKTGSSRSAMECEDCGDDPPCNPDEESCDGDPGGGGTGGGSGGGGSDPGSGDPDAGDPDAGVDDTDAGEDAGEDAGGDADLGSDAAGDGGTGQDSATCPSGDPSTGCGTYTCTNGSCINAWDDSWRCQQFGADAREFHCTCTGAANCAKLEASGECTFFNAGAACQGERAIPDHTCCVHWECATPDCLP